MTIALLWHDAALRCIGFDTSECVDVTASGTTQGQHSSSAQNRPGGWREEKGWHEKFLINFFLEKFPGNFSAVLQQNRSFPFGCARHEHVKHAHVT